MRLSLSLVLAAFVAVLASIIAIKPELMLRVKGGWLPYFLLGYGEVPPQFSKAFWKQDDRDWLNPGDVVVSSAVKSGTTWSVATVHSIRVKGFDTGYLDIFLEAPFVDLVRFPGESRKQKISFFRSVSERYAFGVYKSHFAPPVIKIRDDVKYIVAVRDPIDAVASFRPFLSSLNREFGRMWGGFHTSNDSASNDKIIIQDKGDGKGGLYEDLLLDHIRGWWPHRKRSNVLFLHYKTRLADPSGDIDRISKFMGVTLTPSEKQAVLDTTSFSWMKKNDKRFRVCALFDEPKRYGLMGDYLDCMFTNFMGTGAQRSGDVELPAEMKAEALQLSEKFLGKEILQWLRVGGPMPDVEVPKL